MMGRTAALAPSEQPSGENYLPPTRSNVDLVSRLELSGGPYPFGDVTPDQIADVSVHKNVAYLASWSEGNANQICERGGFFSVDISDPANPKRLAFRRALERNYHGEGMHATSLQTSAFQGDILAVNNETCTPTTDPPNRDVPAGGGFDLWDVSNPAEPKVLSRANGDYGGEGELTGIDNIAHEAHSIFLWQDGGRAFAVIIDNEEEHDVDIFDITNPRAVQPVREYDLDEGDFTVTQQNQNGQGNFATNNSHDMIVKEINGVQTMLMSYWDSGYITLNAENPADLKYIGDTDFDATDPYTGFTPPEGNGHQAEFSHDNRYILAADEDFDTFRLRARITGGPNNGFEFQQAGGADQGYRLQPGDQFEGDTRFVGQACTASPPAPASAGVTIAVAERGSCSFEEKATNVDAAGYDTLLIFNNATGANAQCDGLISMTLGAYRGDLLALFVARSVGMRIIDAYDPATYRCTPGDATSTPAPAAPREGSPLSIAVDFDGWGYAHQYRNGTGKMSKVDDYAIQEGVDERWASRFGDLSIHEWAADPTTNLAYSAYYSGGFRVVQFDESGMTETGRFIDQRPDGKGNDFWGVEQFTGPNCQRLVALSDRDYGLYIVRYTGPGAVSGPCPQPAPGPKAGRCTNLVAVTAGQRLSGAEVGEQITGTEQADVVDAKGGDDCVDGLGGNDDLRGGTGVDAIDGQRGNDRIRGDRGRGNLRGGTGNDRITGHASRDVLFGNTGRDRLNGGGRQDQLFGGGGRDRLTGGRGKDIIEAGTGNDRIFARDGAVDRIDCGFGNDTVASRDRKDKLTSCENKAKPR